MHTKDLGGTATTSEVVDAVLKNVRVLAKRFADSK